MSKMQAALECDYVSSNLHKWIDLIFGYKQVGEEATNSDNLFYPYTYEKHVNWDRYNSPYERQAMKIQVNSVIYILNFYIIFYITLFIFSQVMEFGQTPRQVFKNPHP